MTKSPWIEDSLSYRMLKKIAGTHNRFQAFCCVPVSNGKARDIFPESQH